MIDEKKLIEELFLKIPYKFGLQAMDWFRDLVEAQPTAYDLEKVIENLKNKSQDIALIYTTDKGVDYEYTDGIAIDWAIEIVKEGGVNEQ